MSLFGVWKMHSSHLLWHHYFSRTFAAVCAARAPRPDSKCNVPTPHGHLPTEGLVISVGRKSCGDLFLHADWDRLKGTYLMFNKKKNEVPGATPAGRWCHCCSSSRSIRRQSDNTDWESNNTGHFWAGEPLQTSPGLWDSHLNAVVIVVLLLILLALFCVCLGGISSGKLVEFTFWQGNHFFFFPWITGYDLATFSELFNCWENCGVWASCLKETQLEIS